MLYHIEDIEKIREIEQKTSSKTNLPVFDISNWNSGKNYQDYIYQYLKIPSFESPFNYIYTYEIDEETHYNVRKKLNMGNSTNSSVFLPSSTLAIVNIANFLQKKNCKKVCILQPSYFSVEPCLSSFGLHVENYELDYRDGRFIIPIEKLLDKDFEAVWLTSPVFCTNIYYNNLEYEKINILLQKRIFVICDESLASLGMELCSHLKNSKYLISIHSPHKVLGTNTMKFSCIITHKVQQEFFNIWTDLYAGGLTLSSKAAITHFLSDNYNFVLNKSMKYIYDTYAEIEALLQKHKQYFSYTSAAGVYMTVFFEYVPYEISTKQNFIKKLIESTNVSLLPGYLEGYFESRGFCFRVNLTLDRVPLLLSLNKVILYLEKEYL
uniref:aminotransferase class I/II-fold pyridoxal phosphate-dependent enzyme n=1 Tax=Agathobacter sp. TaxID=2021311 RepID=UPI0040574025